MQPGKLILLPNLLDESLPAEPFLPSSVARVVPHLSGLFAECEKGGRRYLLRFISREALQSIPIRCLNEHSKPEELHELFAPLLKGETWGLISDAGLPCIADPGSAFVAMAHQTGVAIEAIGGPCSILMALQLSGFSGQKFTFHGYLPREPQELQKKLGELEKAAHESVQIWIEAPYRSQKMLEVLKESLQDQTKLSVAASLTLPCQRVVSLPLHKWKQSLFSLEKEPAVFSLSR